MKTLSVIHVAGTKGKVNWAKLERAVLSGLLSSHIYLIIQGSTCAFAERILRTSGYRTGLFTSPHLVDLRERVRLDGELVTEALFAEHFWWCHNRLQARHNLGFSFDKTEFL